MKAQAREEEADEKARSLKKGEQRKLARSSNKTMAAKGMPLKDCTNNLL